MLIFECEISWISTSLNNPEKKKYERKKERRKKVEVMVTFLLYFFIFCEDLLILDKGERQVSINHFI